MPETWVNLMNLNSAHEVSVEGDNPECKTEKMGKYMREFHGGQGCTLQTMESIVF